MSNVFAVEATIDKPADHVWSALTDWDHAHLWMNGVDSMTAHGPTAAGTKLTFHARGKERPSEIAACETGKSIVLRSVQGGVTADYTYSLEPLGERRTQVKLSASCQTRGAWTLLSPLLRYAVKKTDSGQLEALKRTIEAGG